MKIASVDIGTNAVKSKIFKTTPTSIKYIDGIRSPIRLGSDVFKKGKIGEFYNIGSNVNLTNLEVTKKILSISKKKINIGKKVKIIFVKDRPGHDLRYALNSNKMKSKLKWTPKFSFEKGIIKTFSWYLNNQNYFKNFSKKDITKRLGNK